MACLQKIQNLCLSRVSNDVIDIAQPQLYSWNSVFQALRSCRRMGDFLHGKLIHCLVLKLGFSRDNFVSNNLMAMYSDFLSPREVHKVLDEMPDRNVVSWTTLISAYTRSGDHNGALRVYLMVPVVELEMPNGYLLSAVLKACAMSGNIEVGKCIHKRIKESHLQSDTVLMNGLLDMYVKCDGLTDAREVFDQMLHKNITSWNAMIDGYCKNGLVKDALNLFHQMPIRDAVTWNSVISGLASRDDAQALQFVTMMHREGCKLDDFTFTCALNSCGYVGSVVMGKQIHGYMVKLKLSSCFAESALVDMYSKCCEVDEAEAVFYTSNSQEESLHGRMALWNSMIGGYVNNNSDGHALNLVSLANKSGLPLDSYTFGSILKSVTNLSSLRVGMQTHGLMITTGNVDHVIGSVLVGFYMKCGIVKNALRVFLDLPVKDVIAWAGLIWACIQQGLYLLAFSLFREMVYLNLEVDQFIVSTLFKACSCLIELDCGKQVHTFCIKKGYKLDDVTVTSLIGMYSTCGEIEDGVKLFNCTDKKDTISWTGIIVGCGWSGRAQDAIAYFWEMVKSGIKPNAITFLSVLSACRHAGYVKEACEFFRSMRTEYWLVPWLEHYCCMVDLLGRAGRFEEAETLIEQMPYEPDQTIWNSLLGACAIHKDVDRAKLIEARLLAIPSDNISVYVTLSNVYASLGLWDQSIKFRKVVREMGLKDAGRSWIEIRH